MRVSEYVCACVSVCVHMCVSVCVCLCMCMLLMHAIFLDENTDIPLIIGGIDNTTLFLS